MFTPQQMKSNILHPDLLVSHAAITYFSRSNLYRHDPTLMPLVLQRLQQVKKGETFYLFEALHFTQTEETFSTMLELLRVQNLDPNIKFQLVDILLHSDLSLFDAHQDVLMNSKDFKHRLQSRISIANLDNEALIEAFNHFIQDAYGKYMNELDSFYANALVRELALRKCLTAEHVLKTLDSHNQNEQGYEIIYYAQLAGEMQLEEAIPALCRYLGSEDDVLPATAAQALIHIGTDKVVTTLVRNYLEATEEYYRLFAADVFGNVKLPASEEALLTLLPIEEDATNATILADGLCALGSIPGIPLVQKLVMDGCDSQLLDLRESLYAQCIMANVQLPQLDQWKQELEDEQRKRGQRTTTTSTVKIGRNDPCHCGSGKKYKKCCMQ